LIAETRPENRVVRGPTAAPPRLGLPATAERDLAVRIRRVAADLFELTKVRLSSLVLVTTAIGYLHATAGDRTLAGGVAALAGTALAAFGANALNQYAERDLDAIMTRTRGRPLPAGRLAPRLARDLGVALVIAGVALLAVFTTWLAAALAAFSAVSYVLLYTPLKRVSPHSTLLGAVPGALPPVIGYVAAAAPLDLEAAYLFGLLFFWQLPHFYAISWLYRDDYGRAGYPMLAVLDREDGRRVATHSVVHLAILVGLTAWPLLRGASPFYGAAALLFGAAFLHAAIAFRMRRGEAEARRLFRWSLLYLPAVLLALLKG
jgi:protoheme IX farnesyltransferase